MGDSPRYRPDDLRRLAADLLARAGLAAGPAAALAGQLLWFDQVGRSRWGVATLPDWLERVAAGAVDGPVDGVLRHERTATAVVDGAGGLGPLVLARAARLADEKAREVGVGLVRAVHVGPVGPVAAIAADAATGPAAVALLGPGATWAVALPSAGGPPLVHDVALDDRPPGAGAPPAAPPPLLGPWPLLAAEGEWLVQAASVPAFASLDALGERIDRFAAAEAPGSGSFVHPGDAERTRAACRIHGLVPAPVVCKALAAWARRLDVPMPPVFSRPE